MKITVDLSRDIHPIAQMILFFLREKQFDLIKQYFPLSWYKHVEELKQEGYIVSDFTAETPPYMYVLASAKVKRVIGQKAKSEEWINEYRDIFKGKRDGSMGSKGACIKKMDRFMAAHPEYDKEHILKATRRYIASLKNDFRFIQQADYFISKEDHNKIVTSRLENFCEEVDLREKDQIPSEEWNTDEM